MTHIPPNSTGMETIWSADTTSPSPRPPRFLGALGFDIVRAAAAAVRGSPAQSKGTSLPNTDDFAAPGGRDAQEAEVKRTPSVWVPEDHYSCGMPWVVERANVASAPTLESAQSDGGQAQDSVDDERHSDGDEGSWRVLEGKGSGEHGVVWRPMDKGAEQELISFSRDARDAAVGNGGGGERGVGGDRDEQDRSTSQRSMQAELRNSARALLDLWQQDTKSWLTYNMSDSGPGETKGGPGETRAQNKGAEDRDVEAEAVGVEEAVNWKAKAMELQEKCDRMYDLNQRILRQGLEAAAELEAAQAQLDQVEQERRILLRMYEDRDAEIDHLKASIDQGKDELLKLQVRLHRTEEVHTAERARDQEQFGQQVLLYQKLKLDYDALQRDHLNLTQQWRAANSEAEGMRQLRATGQPLASPAGGHDGPTNTLSKGREAGASQVSGDGEVGADQGGGRLVATGCEERSRQQAAGPDTSGSGRTGLAGCSNSGEGRGGEGEEERAELSNVAGLDAQSSTENMVRRGRQQRRRHDEVLDLLITREAALVSTSPPRINWQTAPAGASNSNRLADASASSPDNGILRLNAMPHFEASSVPLRTETSPGHASTEGSGNSSAGGALS